MSQRYASFDEYGFCHFPRHLARNERFEKLREILLDFEWLQAKLNVTDPQPLIDDYGLLPQPVGETTSEYESLRLIQGALRLSANVLVQDKTQLPSQLTGRLLGIEESDLRGLLEQIRKEVKHPWLRPVMPNLVPPGGSLFRTFSGHTSVVCTVMITPDGLHAISVSDDTMENYNTPLFISQTMKAIKMDKPPISMSRMFDSTSTVSEKEYFTIKTWDIWNEVEIRTFHTQLKGVYHLLVTPDCKHAVIPYEDSNQVQIWDLIEGKQLHVWSGISGTFQTITPDGKHLITVIGQNVIKIWNLENGQCVQTINHKKLVMEVILAGQWIILQSNDGELAIWDMFNGNNIRKLSGDFGRVLAITPDKKGILGIKDKKLKLWDLTSGEPLRTIIEHFGTTQTSTPLGESFNNIKSVTPDCRRAISIAENNTVKVWDLETGECLRTLIGISGQNLGAAALSPDGRFAITGSWDRTVKIWDLRSDIKHKSHINQVGLLQAITADGGHFITKSSEGSITFYDMGFHKTRTLNQKGDVKAVLPDNRHILLAQKDTLYLVDIQSGDCLRILKGQTMNEDPEISAAAVIPGGKFVVSGYSASYYDKFPKPLKVWDVEKGSQLFSMSEARPNTMLMLTGYRGHLKSINTIAITPDCNYVISADSNGMIIVWRLQDGKPLIPLNLHLAPVTSVAVSPDEKYIVSGSVDNNIIVWDFSKVFRQSREPPVIYLKGHTNWVNKVAVTLDGYYALSVSEDMTLKVWDLASGSLIAGLNCEEPLINVGIALDGSTIIIGSRNNNVSILKLENVVSGTTITTAWRSPTSTLLNKLRSWLSLPKPAAFGKFKLRFPRILIRHQIAFSCPHCRFWSEASADALGSKLLCPHCNKNLKLNPFVIEGDWQSIAEAWQENRD